MYIHAKNPQTPKRIPRSSTTKHRLSLAKEVALSAQCVTSLFELAEPAGCCCRRLYTLLSSLSLSSFTYAHASKGPESLNCISAYIYLPSVYTGYTYCVGERKRDRESSSCVLLSAAYIQYASVCSCELRCARSRARFVFRARSREWVRVREKESCARWNRSVFVGKYVIERSWCKSTIGFFALFQEVFRMPVALICYVMDFMRESFIGFRRLPDFFFLTIPKLL